jgi:pimeloyl-ACP methyl ester carboxylesterase
MQKLPEMQPVALSYESFGQGMPVIFLHGFPFDHTIWSALVPLLEDRVRLILPDLRGFGSSPVPEGVYSMRLQAEDIVHLMDRLSLERAVLVGHSMGGYISLAFAKAYPNRLLGLGLISTQSAADSPERRQSRYKASEAVAHKGARVVASSMAENLTPKKELLPAILDLILHSRPAGIVGALKGMAERPDMTEALADICVPAVVLAGTSDQILPVERMQMLAQMLPKGWLVDVPGGGHMLMMEEPQQVADALRQLVERVGDS